MFAVLHAVGMLAVDLFKSRARLEAEILLLRHQLNLALRHAPPRVRLHRGDRALMVWMVRLWPSEASNNQSTFSVLPQARLLYE